MNHRAVFDLILHCPLRKLFLDPVKVKVDCWPAKVLFRQICVLGLKNVQLEILSYGFTGISSFENVFLLCLWKLN